MSDLEIINQMRENERKKIVEVEKTIIQKITITEEDFNNYEDCRKSGLTNMFNLSNVELITGLEKKKIKAIIKDYSKLKEDFKR